MSSANSSPAAKRPAELAIKKLSLSAAAWKDAGFLTKLPSGRRSSGDEKSGSGEISERPEELDVQPASPRRQSTDSAGRKKSSWFSLSRRGSGKKDTPRSRKNSDESSASASTPRSDVGAFNGGDLRMWGNDSAAGVSIDAELVSTADKGKKIARTVTVQVGCDGIAIRDIATRELLRKFPYIEIAAWRHTDEQFFFFTLPPTASASPKDKSSFMQWSVKTPEGAALDGACRKAMEELAKVETNLDTFERAITASRKNSTLSRRKSSLKERPLGLAESQRESSQKALSSRGSEFALEKAKSLPGGQMSSIQSTSITDFEDSAPATAERGSGHTPSRASTGAS